MERRLLRLAALVTLGVPMIARAQVPNAAVTGTVEITTIDGTVVENRGQVVVFLEGGGLGATGPYARAAEVVQLDGVFEPSVLAIASGGTIEFPNGDNIFHNIFSLSAPQPFDLGVYPAGEMRSVAFPNTGLVRLFCNIHPEMTGSVLVLANPFFTTTDELGRYRIPQVPAGAYTLRTWHEFGGETRREVIVEGSDVQIPPVEIREDRTVLPHLNKFGRRYGGKYGG